MRVYTSFKGISPVVAMALLLVVAVVSIVSFETWFGTYSSDLFSNAEIKSNTGDSIDIESVAGNYLYVKYAGDDDIALLGVKVGSRQCNISDFNLTKGMNEIDLGFCLIGADEYDEIILITDVSVDSEMQNLKRSSRSLSLGLSYVSPTPAHGAVVGLGSDVVINISSTYDFKSCLLYWYNGSWNTYAMSVNGKNCDVTMSSLGANTYNYFVETTTDMDGVDYVENSSQRTVLSACVSLSGNTDSDGDGYYDAALLLYPACNPVYEGSVDVDDSTSVINVTSYCWLKDDKSGCTGNLVIDGCGAGTVLDVDTGLCWQRDLAGSGLLANYVACDSYCDSLVLGGHSDWRLPVASELLTLFDLSTEAVIGGNNVYFLNSQASAYYSDSTHGGDPTNDKMVLYFGSTSMYFRDKVNDGRALCVRRN